MRRSHGSHGNVDVWCGVEEWRSGGDGLGGVRNLWWLQLANGENSHGNILPVKLFTAVRGGYSIVSLSFIVYRFIVLSTVPRYGTK